jgi:hypothetical protein
VSPDTALLFLAPVKILKFGDFGPPHFIKIRTNDRYTILFMGINQMKF